MFEKILVPLDGSKMAEMAIPYASELARRLGSRITLISVISGRESKDDKYEKLQRFYVQEMVKAVIKVKTKVQSVVLAGDPAAEIIGYAEQNNIGLIIMGTRGGSALKRWVLGSVADKVVSETTIPVALVTAEDAEPVSSRGNILRKALVILDGTPEGEVVLTYVNELASRLNIEVTLLQLVERTVTYFGGADDYSYVPVSKREMDSIKAKARRYLKKLAAPLESNGIAINVKVMTKEKSAENIISAAGRIDAELVVMPTRGRSGIGRWFFNSLRDEIVGAGDLLVLLIKQPE